MTTKTQIRLTLAIVVLLGDSTLSYAQTALPTIDIGQRHKMAAGSNKTPAKPHQQTRAQEPRPSNFLTVDRASPTPGTTFQLVDDNQSFASSDLQNTSLGPKISYPTGSKEQNSSSERFFTGGQINVLPAFRPGEALEVVPGLAVVPHNSEGMASLYYLRGFDLDHGTDLALYLDSMPLNMRTHGHGQGYADANFLMPELLETVDARKGTYNVEDGDFSNAGTIRLKYLHRVPTGVFTSTGGAFGYGRQFGMKSWEYAGGDILGAGEISTYNGPLDNA
jgi:TonB-dependent Receptor Plug Domain